MPTSDLRLLFSGRTWVAVKLKARQLGLCREFTDEIESDMSTLLDDSVLVYYWIGFLMADGYINHKTMRLKFCLAMKDKDQVIKFANFIKCVNHRKDCKKKNAYSVSAQDKKIVSQIINKYGFRPRKTYHPPDLNYLDGDFFVAFFVGLIDGDGCLKKQYKRHDCCMAMKMHRSWIDNLQWLTDKLYRILDIKAPRVKINKKGYARVNIASSLVLKFLKKQAMEWNLPFLNRKWHLINERFRARIEVVKERRKKIVSLYSQNLTGKEIAFKLGVSPACVSKHLSKHI